MHNSIKPTMCMCVTVLAIRTFFVVGIKIAFPYFVLFPFEIEWDTFQCFSHIVLLLAGGLQITTSRQSCPSWPLPTALLETALPSYRATYSTSVQWHCLTYTYQAHPQAPTSL